MRFVGALTAFLLILPAAVPVIAAEQSNACDLRPRTQAAINAFREHSPHTLRYFQDAYAFAIFPAVTRFGVGFGGAFGRGVVIRNHQVIGRSNLWQFTSGIQAGIRNVTTIVFLKDEQALHDFESGNTEFVGQAGIALATIGLNGTPAYNDGVAIFTRTRLGLMAEFTVSAARFSYTRC